MLRSRFLPWIQMGVLAPISRAPTPPLWCLSAFATFASARLAFATFAFATLAFAPPAFAASAPIELADVSPPISTRALKDDASFTRFMDQLDFRWRDLEVRMRRCEIETSPSDSCQSDRWAQALSELLATPEYVDVVWRRRSKVTDPGLRARMDGALPVMLAAVFDRDPALRQVLDPLADTVASFRPEVGGILVMREQAREIMRRDDDRVRRRAAYESGAPLSQGIAPDLRELMRRRNLLAQRFGYRDFVELKLRAERLDAQQMRAIEDTLERATRAPYRRLCQRLRGRLGVFQLHPWDLAYGQWLIDASGDTTLKGGDAGVRLASFVAGLGLNPDALPIRLEFNQAGTFRTRCVPVDPPTDIRIISNPSDGLNGYISLFHEYGRGMLEAHLPDPRPSVRGVPEVWREAQGALFGNLTVEPYWLEGGLNLSDSSTSVYRRDWLDSRLLSLRGLIMLSRFERELYTRPDAHPDSLWRAYTERYLDVEASDASLWASETPLLVQPLGYSRYLAGEVIAAQLLAAARSRFGQVEGGKMGQFLVEEVYKPSATSPWDQVLLRATGTRLDAHYLARELGGQ